MNLTSAIRPGFERLARRTDSWASSTEDVQRRVLASLLRRGASTAYGRAQGFGDIARSPRQSERFAQTVPTVAYEDIRPLVMRMVRGEKDVLWPGRTRDFAQSSGTSGGRSKFIPITADMLSGNHYRGSADTVGHYLRQVEKSRLFDGKAFILGGSFGNTLGLPPGRVNIGDLSATLINRMNPLANLLRIPDRKTALLADWEEKLPALVKASAHADVTNISGVPSWFLTVMRRVMEARRADSISSVWPNLEVFFHGGISFDPYREEYRRLTDPSKMHFLETYNASEGFFAVQNDFDDPGMLLIIDRDIYYEFIPLEGTDRRPVPAWQLKQGDLYEMVITASNGLWRYRLGDTVRVTSTAPVKITVAGRTRSFINAFGEELMEDNAERAVARACRETGAVIADYTAAPLFAAGGRKARHQWLVEWRRCPDSTEKFTRVLDEELRRLNSDYDAKRSHSIFLDTPQLTEARPGLFTDWLAAYGNRKLGGQRKVPRLSNTRTLLEQILAIDKK